MADEQSANDLAQRVELGLARLDQPGTDVVPEPEVAAGRLGVAGARLGSALLVFGGGVAELGVVDPRAGEVGLLAGRRGLAVVEVLVDEVDHEGGVDDPDAGGEVPPAVVDERVAAVAGPVAHLGGDPHLERPSLGARGERVQLAVELVDLAAEDRRDLPTSRVVEVWAGVVDLLGGVEHGAPSSMRTA